MMRNTPSARLLGHLLMWIRWAGTGASIRATARAADLPPATVAQIEKGQRALKKPKIASLAGALEVDSDDLMELWELCQGLVRDSSGRLNLYTQVPDPTPSASHTWSNRPGETERDHELNPEFRLAGQICTVMSRVMPRAQFDVQPARPDDPIPHALELDGIAAHQAPSEIPVLWVQWNDPNALDEVAALALPLITGPSKQDRAIHSVASPSALDELIRTLTVAERERVRGYVEAVIEQRAVS